MKKTQILDMLRNVRKQWVSFISIMVIALLGVMVFLMLIFSITALNRNISENLNALHFRDIELISTLLFSEDDLESIRNTQGVADAEPVYTVTGKAIDDSANRNVYVVSLTERISLTQLVEGRLPETDEECAVEATLAQQMGWTVGSTVTVQPTAGTDFLRVKRFTVTGIANHPDNSNTLVGSTYYVMVIPEAFDLEALDGCFMRVEAALDIPEGTDRFSEEYLNTSAAVAARLETLSQTAAPQRESQAYELLWGQLEAGQREWDEGAAQLAEARAQLDEGWAALADGEEKVAAGKQELADARRELDDGWKQLEDGRRQLNDLEIELLRGERKLKAGRAELADAEAQLNAGRAELEQGWNALEDVKAQFRDGIRGTVEAILGEDSSSLVSWAGRSEFRPDSADATAMYVYIANGRKIDLNLTLAENLSLAVSVVPDSLLMAAYRAWCHNRGYTETETDPAAVRTMLGEKAASMMGSFADRYNAARSACQQWDAGHQKYLQGLAAYNEGLATLQKGQADYDEGQHLYNVGYDVYSKGLAKYNESLARYEQGLADLAAGEKELEENRERLEEAERVYAQSAAALADGERELADARARLSDMAPCRWIVMDINSNPGYVQVSGGTENLEQLTGTFALLFLVVGALVIYATVSKIVDDQRKLVGTTKALGFLPWEILAKYLFFGVSATVLGALLGILLAGSSFLQDLIIDGYDMNSVFDLSRTGIVPLPSALAVLAAAALAASAVFAACSRLLRTPAVRLLQTQVPSGAKKSAGTRSGRSLYSRLILLNMLTDFKRVLVTVVSVAGCCALVVIGVSLRSSLMGSLDMQLNEIVDYDWQLKYSPEEAPEAGAEIEAALRQAGAEYVPIYWTDMTYRFGTIEVAELMCGDVNEIGKLYHLRDWKTGEDLPATDNGILIQRRVAECFDLDVGSEFELTLGGTRVGTVRVAGVFEHYVGRVMMMTPRYFERVFLTTYTPNAFLVRLNGADAESLEKTLLSIPGFGSLVRSDYAKATFDAVAGTLRILMTLFIFMGAVMAGVVQMNLANIYVMEKKRELTIMRVNGFTVREVVGYMLRETVLTTILGILLGLVLGVIINNQIVHSLEQPYLQLVRGPRIPGLVAGAVMTVLFTVAVNYIALRPVKHLKLTDAAG